MKSTHLSLRLSILSALAITLLAHCSQSEFSGGSGNSNKANKNRTGDQVPGSDGVNSPGSAPQGANNDGGTLDSDSGGVDGCALGNMVEDPSIVASYVSSVLVKTINELPEGYTAIPTAKSYAGAFHFDKVTADAVCKLQGFVESTTFTEGKFDSCPDNAIATWDESKKDFIVGGACNQNSKIKTVTCKGKLKDPCKKEKSWIFKK